MLTSNLSALTCRSGVWGTNTYSWLFIFEIIVQETIDFAYLKAGTFLGDAWEITMTNDLGMGIIALQVFEQPWHGDNRASGL